MPRKAPEIILTKEQQARLEKITRSHDAERWVVERASIVLGCVAGKQNREVTAGYETSLPRVSKWSKRFIEHGFSGIEDEYRPGKPETYGEPFRDKLLSKLETKPPEGLARWVCPSLAEEPEATMYA